MNEKRQPDLAARRAALGKSMAQCARELGVTLGALSRIEANKVERVDVRLALRMAEIYDCPVHKWLACRWPFGKGA
jgi:transcriptional regulator with XRE-family HTH domain